MYCEQKKPDTGSTCPLVALTLKWIKREQERVFQALVIFCSFIWVPVIQGYLIHDHLSRCTFLRVCSASVGSRKGNSLLCLINDIRALGPLSSTRGQGRGSSLSKPEGPELGGQLPTGRGGGGRTTWCSVGGGGTRCGGWAR